MDWFSLHVMKYSLCFKKLRRSCFYNLMTHTCIIYVRFVFLTVVFIKCTIFVDITQCSPLIIVNRRFGGTCHLHLQGRKISREKYKRESRWQAELAYHLRSPWYLTGLILQPWRCRWYVPPKRRLTFNGLHRVMFQKIVISIYFVGFMNDECCFRNLLNFYLRFI
jgi:hypothetical protein